MQLSVPGGTTLLLLPQRAAYLPEQRTLLVADAHLGKAQSFRRLGVPVPRGTTLEALDRLSALLAATGARRIVFLGDLLHSAKSRGLAIVAAVAKWRQDHAALDLTLVRGNHDSHAGDPPSEWGIDCVDEPFAFEGSQELALAHHPTSVAGRYVLAGHVHPAARIGGRARDSLRLPCFHFGPQVGVLPAFGDFTGMHVLPRGPRDRVVVIAGETLRALNFQP